MEKVSTVDIQFLCFILVAAPPSRSIAQRMHLHSAHTAHTAHTQNAFSRSVSGAYGHGCCRVNWFLFRAVSFFFYYSSVPVYYASCSCNFFALFFDSNRGRNGHVLIVNYTESDAIFLLFFYFHHKCRFVSSIKCCRWWMAAQLVSGSGAWRPQLPYSNQPCLLTLPGRARCVRVFTRTRCDLSSGCSAFVY